MAVKTILETGGFLLLGLAGLVLFVLGAYGSLRLPWPRVQRAFTWKQRLQFTLYGLLLMAVAFFSLAGLAGGGS